MSATEQIGRVTSASVEKATGKSWDQWLAILEKAGARAWTHQETVAFLGKRHKLSPWWQQGVTHGFEVATGRRLDGQNQRGEYTVTATKSLHSPAKKVWTALTSDEGLAIWLKPLFKSSLKPGAQFETEDGYFGEVRTLLKGRRLRLSWSDPQWPKKTVVQITLVARPMEKSILVFDHTQIKDTRIQAQMRQRWRAAAEGLSALMRA